MRTRNVDKEKESNNEIGTEIKTMKDNKKRREKERSNQKNCSLAK
jgi:hypothetical protein